MPHSLLSTWSWGWWGWWHLRAHARLDVRDRVMTPQLGAIVTSARHDFHTELLQRDAELATLAARTKELQIQAEVLQRDLRDLLVVDEQRDAFYGEEDLLKRRTGEGRLEEDVVRRRRRREADREAVERLQRITAVRSKLNAAQAELDAVPARAEEIERRFDDRCGVINERAGMYMAIYWRTLVRHHPARAQLNRLYDPLQTPLRDWMSEQNMSQARSRA
jgi:hypothetical protein